MSKQKVAFIGLGVMGYPMAGHLAKAGYETRVYNRTAAKAEQWCEEYGGSHGLTPREAAEGADPKMTYRVTPPVGGSDIYNFTGNYSLLGAGDAWAEAKSVHIEKNDNQITKAILQGQDIKINWQATSAANSTPLKSISASGRWMPTPGPRCGSKVAAGCATIRQRRWLRNVLPRG